MAKKSSANQEEVKNQNKRAEEEVKNEEKNSPETEEKKKSGEKNNKSSKSASRTRDKKEKKMAELEARNQELNDKYLRLSAEFDNYRKRTLKEKSDLLRSAGQDTIIRILPVLDDFERALQSMEAIDEKDAAKQGIGLIYNKLKEILTQLGLKEISAKGEEFDTDLHEAVTKIPAPDKELKGKVVEVIEKGYYLNDKVIRFSKVIIGE